MEVKPGYKQANLEEWHTKKFGEVAVPRSERIDSRRTGVCDFCIELEHIESGSGVTLGSTSTTTNSSLKSVFHPGDVLFGKLRAYLRKYWKASRFGVCSTEIWVLVPQDNVITSEFLFQVIQTDHFIEVASNSYGTHMPRSDWNVVKNHELMIPSIPEQNSISEALCDVDGLLGGLDRFIAKKRDLKQAAMQQLLTGQTRLPGFHGEWEVKRLGDVLKVRHGKSQHGITAPDGEFPILASGGEIGRTNTPLYDKPSVLIGRKGTIDSPQYVSAPFWTVDTLFFTEISGDAVAKFVFYKFTMIPWRSYNEASGVPSLNAKTIENIEIQFPPTKAEQTAIAEVLTDMDAELAALEQRREKTRALKQAMMQELLTGRIRLVGKN